MEAIQILNGQLQKHTKVSVENYCSFVKCAVECIVLCFWDDGLFFCLFILALALHIYLTYTPYLFKMIELPYILIECIEIENFGFN